MSRRSPRRSVSFARNNKNRSECPTGVSSSEVGGESGIRFVLACPYSTVRSRQLRLSRRGLRTCLLACSLHGPFESHFAISKKPIPFRNRPVFRLWRREWDLLRLSVSVLNRTVTTIATITPGPTNMPSGMFASRPVRIPLRHKQKTDSFQESACFSLMAERVGFEPTWACTLTVFKTAPL